MSCSEVTRARDASAPMSRMQLAPSSNRVLRISAVVFGLGMLVSAYFAAFFWWQTAIAWPLEHAANAEFKAKACLYLTLTLGLLMAYSLSAGRRPDGKRGDGLRRHAARSTLLARPRRGT